MTAVAIFALLFIARVFFNAMDMTLPLCFLLLCGLAHGYAYRAWSISKSALKKTDGEYPTHRELNDALDEFDNISMLVTGFSWLASIVTFIILLFLQWFDY